MSSTYIKEFADVFKDCAVKSRFASSMSDRVYSITRSINNIHIEYAKFSKPDIHEKDIKQIQDDIHTYAEQVVQGIKVLKEHLRNFDETFKDKRIANYVNN